MAFVIRSAVAAGHSVGHVVIDHVTGLLDCKESVVSGLQAWLFVFRDKTCHLEAVIIARSVQGDYAFAVINFVDSFFN